MSNFKPLLASPVEFDKLDYGNIWLSAKLDGIRAIVINGVVVSRKLLPIPNDYVQHLFGKPEYEGLDGELIVGPSTSPTVYTDTYSGTMKKAGEPDVRFYAFDHIGNPKEEYHVRRMAILDITRNAPLIFAVPHRPISSEEQLLATEEAYLDEGYEGVMLRAWHGPKSHYKFGRSTAKEGTLLKLKRMETSEAVVIGVIEEQANMNEVTLDELGHTKRSSHQENKVGKGRLGALVCRNDKGQVFNIGTGFTAADREAFWKEDLVGRIASYNHFPIGAKDAPRFPSFKGWRSPIDIS